MPSVFWHEASPVEGGISWCGIINLYGNSLMYLIRPEDILMDKLAHSGVCDTPLQEVFADIQLFFSCRTGRLPQRRASFSCRTGALPQRRASFSCRTGALPQRCVSFSCRTGALPQRRVSFSCRTGALPQRRVSFSCRTGALPQRRVSFSCRTGALMHRSTAKLPLGGS